MDNYSLWSMWRDIFQYVKPYRKKFIISCIFRFTSELANLFPAFAFSTIVTLLATNDQQAISQISTYMVLWIILVYYYRIGHDLCKYFGYNVSKFAAVDAVFDALKHMFTLDLNWHEKENA